MKQTRTVNFFNTNNERKIIMKRTNDHLTRLFTFAFDGIKEWLRRRCRHLWGSAFREHCYA